MGSYSDNGDEFFDAHEAFASMLNSGSDCSLEDCSTSRFDYDYWVGNLEKGYQIHYITGCEHITGREHITEALVVRVVSSVDKKLEVLDKSLNNWGLALQELSAIVPAREKHTIVRSGISKKTHQRTGVPVVGNKIPFNELYSQSAIYIARDGEWETCVIEVIIYGRDPNWGQAACAAGSAASNYLKEAGDAHSTVKIQISIVEKIGWKGTKEEYEDEGDYEQKLHSTTNKNSG
ncbi:unnamed protein product [Lactuca saligna]|uniref:Uncharacterized protein n=1 Tax=Lactuca saligna TaxID=75948 RepID=A0AA35VIV7_LACSI|nr:unnamed protein product [Lactuca saligna]